MNDNETISNDSISKEDSKENQQKKLTLINFIKIAVVCHPVMFKPMKGKFDLLVQCETHMDAYALLNKIFKEYFNDNNIPYEERLEVFINLKTVPLADELKQIYQMVDEEQRSKMKQWHEDKLFILHFVHEMRNIASDDYEKQFQTFIKNYQQSKEIPKVDVVQITEPLYFSGVVELQQRKEKIVETMENASQIQLERILEYYQQKVIEKQIEKHPDEDLPYVETVINFDKLTSNELKEIEKILNIIPNK